MAVVAPRALAGTASTQAAAIRIERRSVMAGSGAM
jgi:hypothetical protein